MQGYVLERVTSGAVRRDGQLYWSMSAATREAERLVRAGRAASVRLLLVTVRYRPVAVVPDTESEVQHG